MKIFANRFILGLVAFSLLAWIAAAANVTGTWKGTIEDTHPLTFNLHENAGVVTGTVSGLPPNGDPKPISNGKVTGDQISFDTSGPAPDGKIITEIFSGKVSGNQIQGSFKTPEGEKPVTVTKE